MVRMMIVWCVMCAMGVAYGDENEVSPKAEMSLSEIEQQVREAYDSIKTIELDIDFDANLQSFTEPPPSVLPYMKIYFLATPEKFLFKLDKSDGVLLESSEAFVWDGRKCLGFSQYFMSNSSQGHSSTNPDGVLVLPPYPLPWNIFTRPTYHHHWFESNDKVLSGDMVMIDGHWCYEVLANTDPTTGTTVLAYKTYLDPGIGFMPRRVDKIDPEDSSRVVSQKRYSNYQEVDIGLWFATRIEQEFFRHTKEVPTKKHLYTLNTLKVNKSIDESKIFIRIPAGVPIIDEQKMMMQQRLSYIKTSPITRPLIICLLIVLGAVSIKLYLTQRNKG